MTTFSADRDRTALSLITRVSDDDG